MSRTEKIIEKLRQAKADVSFSELERVLLHFGYIRVRQKGSHVHFRKQASPFLTIPIHQGKVKIVYVKEILKLLAI